MILDRSHIKYATGAGVATLAIGAQYYLLYKAPIGAGEAGVPSGGSKWGLFYGILGWLIIVFGCALWPRRRMSQAILGSGQSWLRWHIWLCLLCVPIVLFHSAVAMRGFLAGSVAVLFGIVILSGVWGLGMQQYLPRRMTWELKRESVLDEIPSLFYQLALEACMKVRGAVLAEGWDGAVPASLERPVAPGEPPQPPPAGPVEVTFRPGTKALVDFYANQVRPYLEGRHSGLETEAARIHCFNHVRTLIPESAFDTIDDLEGICQERADLERQRFLHRLLHGWQLIHVPLSMALLVLVTIHALMAIRFINLPFRIPGIN